MRREPKRAAELHDVSGFLVLQMTICTTRTTFIGSRDNLATNVHAIQNSELRDRLTMAMSHSLLYTEVQ
jgi:hypothetical protein